ncbi:MAG: hypothetical protein JEZ00_15135 [Anaerolineaceae bacterium]|nr:hypothetical protein [Anaerolineaceae bacterium]
MSEKTLRMVNLKHALTKDGAVRNHTVNTIFEEMDNANPPSAADYGVTDSDKVHKLTLALGALSEINDVFFSWLEADASHVVQFAEDPISAVKAVCPDFDTGLIDNLKNILTE